MAECEEMLELYKLGDTQLSDAISYCAKKAVESSDVNDTKEWMALMNKALDIQRQRAEMLLKDETAACNLSFETAKLNANIEADKYKSDKMAEIEAAKIESQEKVAKTNLIATAIGAVAGVLTFVGTIVKSSSDRRIAEMNNKSQERCVEMAVDLDKEGEIPYQTANKLGQMPRR